ncbi:MAG: RNA polymerase sigma factor RpoH [Rhizobacter sp.]|nr:RNA polymerase sigma factor RpoH [Rhizobacter sp.]
MTKYTEKLGHKRVKPDDAKEYRRHVNAAKRHLVQIEKDTKLSPVEIKRSFQAIVVGEAEAMQAKSELTEANLRLVVSIAKKYKNRGLQFLDLIQEGNIGLMKAVKRFDPEQGVRLVSYALHWIKAEIHEYILKNWRMVKVATTKAQRKLFFNLRSMKQGLKSEAGDDETHRNTLTPSEVAQVAARLNVKPDEVVEMETRLSGGDVALEPQTDDGEESYAPIAYLADETQEPTRALEARHRDWLAGDGIGQALEVLDARSRRVVEERWLKVNDDSSGGMTLHQLASEYGVSAERIRQIEVAALKKMRKALEPA